MNIVKHIIVNFEQDLPKIVDLTLPIGCIFLKCNIQSDGIYAYYLSSDLVVGNESQKETFYLPAMKDNIDINKYKFVDLYSVPVDNEGQPHLLNLFIFKNI